MRKWLGNVRPSRIAYGVFMLAVLAVCVYNLTEMMV